MFALTSVLDHVHGSNIVHRDIKPANILISRDGRIYIFWISVDCLIEIECLIMLDCLMELSSIRSCIQHLSFMHTLLKAARESHSLSASIWCLWGWSSVSSCNLWCAFLFSLMMLSSRKLVGMISTPWLHSTRSVSCSTILWFIANMHVKPYWLLCCCCWWIGTGKLPTH